MRPPYGFVFGSRTPRESQLTIARRDIDDRVRYISLQMGLTPIIWTSTGGNTFDTRDWQIGGGVVNATDVYTNFESYLTTAATSLASGFIVLAHDLYQQSVELAVSFPFCLSPLVLELIDGAPQVDYILPNVINAGVLTLEPIITCLGLTMAEACKSSSLPLPQRTALISSFLQTSRPPPTRPRSSKPRRLSSVPLVSVSSTASRAPAASRIPPLILVPRGSPARRRAVRRRRLREPTRGRASVLGLDRCCLVLGCGL